MTGPVLRSVSVGARRQWTLVRRLADYWLFVAMSPLTTIMFVAIVRSVGRSDLGSNAVIGVALITAWQTGTFVAGDTLARDRQFGILELNLAAPVDLPWYVAGRVAIAAGFSFVPFTASLVTARLLFGPEVMTVADPGRMVIIALCTWAALFGALLCLASVFVKSGRSTAIGNGISYPLFLLSGIVVPVAFLPGWTAPISSLIFLRWSAQGFRQAATGSSDSVLPSVVGLSALAALTTGLGAWLLVRLVDSMRRTGTIVFQ